MRRASSDAVALLKLSHAFVITTQGGAHEAMCLRETRGIAWGEGVPSPTPKPSSNVMQNELHMTVKRQQ
jgi:hypothetical protein